MSCEPIGTATGVEAMRVRLNKVDPGKSAYNIVLGHPGTKYPEGPNVPVEGTMKKLIDGHNDYCAIRDDLLKIRSDLTRRPF